MSSNWYVMQSKPHKELQLVRQLQAGDVETFYPAIRVKPVNPRSRKIRPLFPRYLFVRLDLILRPASEFMWMENAIGLVSFGGEPAPVPDVLIEHVRDQLSQMADGSGFVDEFVRGDRIRIMSGPFRDYEGMFDMRLSGTDRVRVLLEFLHGRTVSVQLNNAQFKKV